MFITLLILVKLRKLYEVMKLQLFDDIAKIDYDGLFFSIIAAISFNLPKESSKRTAAFEIFATVVKSLIMY